MVGAEVRAARPEDAAEMARVHVQSWRETYRGLMRDELLDDPGLLASRERFWKVILTDPRYGENRVAVAESDGRVVGIAMSGMPADDEASTWPVQLHVLYLLRSDQGTGLGRGLLDAVLSENAGASLWVADPNPRAQAFYRKAGFRPDGVEKVEEGIRHLHLVREPGAARPARPA